MLGNFGMTEILMVLVIVLVLFGAKRIPEMGASIGKGIREFKRGVSDMNESLAAPDDDGPRPQRAALATDGPAREPRRLLD